MHQNESQARFMLDANGKSVRVVQNSVSTYSRPAYDGNNSRVMNNQHDQYVRTIRPSPISAQRYDQQRTSNYAHNSRVVLVSAQGNPLARKVCISEPQNHQQLVRSARYPLSNSTSQQNNRHFEDARKQYVQYANVPTQKTRFPPIASQLTQRTYNYMGPRMAPSRPIQRYPNYNLKPISTFKPSPINNNNNLQTHNLQNSATNKSSINFETNQEHQISEAIAREEALMQNEEHVPTTYNSIQSQHHQSQPRQFNHVRASNGLMADDGLTKRTYGNGSKNHNHSFYSYTNGNLAALPRPARLEALKTMKLEEMLNATSPTAILATDSQHEKDVKSVMRNILQKVSFPEERSVKILKNPISIQRTINPNSHFDGFNGNNNSYAQPQTRNIAAISDVPTSSMVYRMPPNFQRQSDDFLRDYMENYRKEVNKRRNRLENRAEEELGVQSPWRRTRNKGLKQIKKKELEICDPRFITLGGSNLQNREVALKMKLDSTHEEAKIVLASDLDRNIKGEIVEEPNSENEPKPSPSTAEETTTESNKNGSESPLRHSQRLLKRQPTPTENSKKASAKRSSDAALRRAKRARGQSSSDNDSDANTKALRFSPSSFKMSSLSSSTLPSVNIRQQKVIQNDDEDEDDEHNVIKREKHCSCGAAYDPKKFYISCGECKNWFHGKCVGITEKKAQKQDEWICSECEKDKNLNTEEVYCLCRQPYDESQFYVGCDICDNWFHAECVGSTQEEITKYDTFVCPNCKDSTKLM